MSTVEIPEELQELIQQTWFDHALHYALFLGAIFQLVCIAAIIVLPNSPEDEDQPEDTADQQGRAGHEGPKQDVANVVKGSGPGASSQGGGAKNKSNTSKKARKRK